MDDITFANKIADLCYKKYSSLGKTGKPRNGEWTLLSGIVKSCGNHLSVVSLATGSKCIGRKAMSSNGTVLNDSHAEVLAKRCFLRYLYHQLLLIKHSKDSEIFFGINHKGKYVLKPEISFHFFSSHVPCGDASIIPKTLICEKEGVIGSEFESCLSGDVEKEENLKICDKYPEQGAESIDLFCKRSLDSLLGSDTEMGSVNKKLKSCNSDFEDDCVGHAIIDVHRTGAKCVPKDLRQDPRGSGIDYHVIRAVRTKPGRGDPTLSVSCSDKIARWVALGIQGALLSLLLEHPIHISTITIGEGGPFSYESVNRALIERTGTNHRPKLLRSEKVFENSRCLVENGRPCSSAVMWTDVPEKATEVVVQGYRQGATKKSKEKSLLVAKKELLKMFINLTGAEYSGVPYREIKQFASCYQEKWKQTVLKLGSWTQKPSGLEDFSISITNTSQ